LIGARAMTTLAPHWSDRLSPRAFRWLAHVGLAGLDDEHAAAIECAKRSRAELHDDEFGKAVADAIDAWLSKHGLELRH
jgi:hypothetical protein